MLICILILILRALCRKPMTGDRKHYFVKFCFFGGALIVGGSGLVEWGKKSDLEPAKIKSFVFGFG